MMADESNEKLPLPIDKEYLIASLKDFEKYILSRKYTNGITYEPKIGKVTIVDKVENANVKVTIDNENKNIVFDFSIPQGRSIKSISKDDNDNIIVKYTDNTTQSIGKLRVNVEADFLTSGGFGNLRYYNGRFQKYDKDLEEWVDTAATPDNVLIVNMIPNSMQRIIGIYDYEVGKNKLKWLEPSDTVVDNQTICVVEKVIIRRKLGEVPQNENDGELVLAIERKDFGSHDVEWWFDDGVIPALGDIWYYKAFPVSTTGFVNVSNMNERKITVKDYYLLGFTIINYEPDTKNIIELVEDCKGFRYAGMDYNADVFRYGDWEDFWFIRDCKPCMLRYDGTVAYFLNRNNKKLKEDGTPSDVSNPNFEGNAMNQNPPIYWGFTLNNDGSATYLFSDKALDGFVYWQNLDENGNFTPYWYTPCYPGAVIDGVMRSLSGYYPTTNTTRQQEIGYATANNKNGGHAWYTEVACDRILIDLLLLLIGGDTNTETVYGNGNNNSYVSSSNTGIKQSGIIDDKGMFYGKNDDVSPMCVFGILDYYGTISRALAGWVNDHGTQKIKMTYSQEDGSTIDGYNLDGSGYIVIPNSTPSGVSGGYISKMNFTEYGLIPIEANGSATTYYADSLRFDNNIIGYARVGGSSNNGLGVGAFCLSLNSTTSNTGRTIGAALSCKPLAQTGGAS